MQKIKFYLFTVSILLVSLILFSSSKGARDVSILNSTATTVIDIDGNTYKTVLIEDKNGIEREWMAENLRVTKLNDGTEIPNITSGETWSNLTELGYCWYRNNSEKYAASYGALYNWYAVETGNLCPEGWRVPSRNEWNAYLRDSYGGNASAGGALKATGTLKEGDGLWRDPNEGATNESGFTAVPNGLRDPETGKFKNLGYSANFWTSTSDATNRSARITLQSAAKAYSPGWAEKTFGYAVRCVKNN